MNLFKQGRNLLRFTQDVNLGKSASYNLVTGEYNPEHGYMVNLAGREQKTKWKKDNRQNVKDYIGKYGVELNQTGCYLGAWIHEGYLYLDVSVLVDTYAAADKLAGQNSQISVFDNKHKIAIFL